MYRPQDKKIFVRAGMAAGDIFRGLSQELAHARLDKGEYKRNEHAFTAYCASYMLCSRYNVAKGMGNVHARQLYDTGVDAKYGDQLITLSTCEYTYNNGRFVVVAKKV